MQMTDRKDRLYELLPAIYRLRDADQGYPLRALLRVISEQVNAVEDDIAQLYENWFIETCQDWVVPYIGDLIGYRQVHEAGEPTEVSTLQGREHNKILIPRREVARTIYYRRRKGTLALLEEISNDVAGWPGRAVEFYRLLSFTQSLNHLRLDQGKTVDLRNVGDLDLLNGPFDRLSHTVDVRRPNSHRGQGRFNIPSVGLFVWPLRPYTETRVMARCLEPEHFQRYSFSPMGNDVQLLIKPEREPGPTHIAEETNLPSPIRRLDFERDKVRYYGADKSLQIWVNDPWRPVSEDEIVVANLDKWLYEPSEGEVAVDPVLGRIVFPTKNPPSRVRVSYIHAFSADMGGGEYERQIPETPMIAICSIHREDIEDATSLVVKLRNDLFKPSHYIRSRFSKEPIDMLDSYNENLDAKVSPGKEQLDAIVDAVVNELNDVLMDEELYDYERFEGSELLHSLDKDLQNEVDMLIKLKWAGLKLQERQLNRLNRLLLESVFPLCMSYHLYRVGEGEEFRTINDALHKWNEDVPRYAVIEITDSGLYQESINHLKLGKNQNLQLRAANLMHPIIDLLEKHRGPSDLLTIEGSSGSRLVIDGLMIAGLGVKLSSEFAEIVIMHTTLVPGYNLYPSYKRAHHGPSPSLILSQLKIDGKVIIEHSIIGPIETETESNKWLDPIKIDISDSILDISNPDSTRTKLDVLYETRSKVANAALTIRRTTFKGRVRVHAIELAEDSIFYEEVQVARSQWGCMRFCYVAPGSYTPKRFSCQPDLAEKAVKERIKDPVQDIQQKMMDEAQQMERLRVRPKFNCIEYGKATYCQLSDTCAEEITRGSEDRSEMGAFHDLFNPQREANLRARLQEYTPAGMDAGVIIVNILEENEEEEYER
jgi:hypothetical protein